MTEQGLSGEYGAASARQRILLMFQLNTPSRAVFDPVLVRDPVYLRLPAAGDYAPWARLREESRTHLVLWEEDWSPEDLSYSAFRRRLKRIERDARRGGGLSLFVFERETRILVGGTTLTNIRYGAARAGNLGYWVGASHARRGYGAAAVKAVLGHAFDTIGLNRVEAACQPENQASRGLLAKCGFRREGCAKDYLKINGRWRDHDLFAITAQEFRNREDTSG